MIEVAASETIDAPVDEVFNKMSRLETLPQWLVGCEKAWAISEDPYRVGGEVAHIDQVMGQRFEARYLVREWEPNEKLLFETISGGPFEGSSDLSFFEKGETTRVEICIRGRLKGALRLGDWAANRVAQTQLNDSVRTAKDLIESGRL
ncbi:MAG: SRPBCC family protein [Actinomycetota bacterium]